MTTGPVLGISVLVFGILIVGSEIFVMIRRNKGWGIQSSRTVGISLIVVAALFLAAADVPADRVTPVIGVLATIAGYLLGRNDRSNSNE
jgi:hypothetical protein